jgi:hypothetical protein
MNLKPHTIFRLLLVIIPVLLAMAQARAQGDTVCVGGTSTWVVENVPGDSYVWELYNDVEGLNLAVEPGNCPVSEAYFVDGVNTGDSVEVMCLVPGTYFIKVTATNECPTNNLKIGRIVVEECYSYAIFLEPDPICSDDKAMMTLVITGGAGPWDVTFTNGTDIWTMYVTVSPFTFQLIPTPTLPGSYQYWITSVTNAVGIINNEPSDPVTLIVKPRPVTSPIYRY